MCSVWAILLSFYKWMTGEVTSAIVLGGFMRFGRQVLWTWRGWLLLSWIITASVAESGTFADDSGHRLGGQIHTMACLHIVHSHGWEENRPIFSRASPSRMHRPQITKKSVNAAHKKYSEKQSTKTADFSQRGILWPQFPYLWQHILLQLVYTAVLPEPYIDTVTQWVRLQMMGEEGQYKALTLASMMQGGAIG